MEDNTQENEVILLKNLVMKVLIPLDLMLKIWTLPSSNLTLWKLYMTRLSSSWLYCSLLAGKLILPICTARATLFPLSYNGS